jgi:hypothetical protein
MLRQYRSSLCRVQGHEQQRNPRSSEQLLNSNLLDVVHSTPPNTTYHHAHQRGLLYFSIPGAVRVVVAQLQGVHVPVDEWIVQVADRLGGVVAGPEKVVVPVLVDLDLVVLLDQVVRFPQHGPSRLERLEDRPVLVGAQQVHVEARVPRHERGAVPGREDHVPISGDLVVVRVVHVPEDAVVVRDRSVVQLQGTGGARQGKARGTEWDGRRA